MSIILIQCTIVALNKKKLVILIKESGGTTRRYFFKFCFVLKEAVGNGIFQLTRNKIWVSFKVISFHSSCLIMLLNDSK